MQIGEIYALEGLALDSPRNHPTVIEVLTAFIRGELPACQQMAPSQEVALSPPCRRRSPSSADGTLRTTSVPLPTLLPQI